MKQTYKGTNITITKSIQQYAEQKISALSKYSSKILIARIELEKLTIRNTKDTFRCEVNLDTPSNLYRAESAAGDLYAAIGLTIPKLAIQLQKNKKKAISSTRKTRRSVKEEILS